MVDPGQGPSTPSPTAQPAPVPSPTPEGVWVSVPATTANLGPGFDCLGAALTCYNRFHFAPGSPEQPVVIQAQGAEAHRVATDASNLVYQAFCAAFAQGQRVVPPVRLTIDLGVPLARGLGSSSTAIVAGLLGANALGGGFLDRDSLAQLATDLEGHPDNVVPALLGGCRLATVDDQGQGWLCEIPWHPAIVPVVVVPDFELSTVAARQVMPQQYRREEVVYTAGHVGLLIRALATGNGDWLRVAMGDRIHVPYRQGLIPGYGEVVTAAQAAGAYGVTISGAGPTLLALASPDRAAAIAAAMAEAWTATGVAIVQAQALALDLQGATVSPA